MPIVEKLDAKFDGVIFKVKDGTIVPPDEYMVFLAKDTAFANTLETYYQECVKLGADTQHLMSVKRMMHRVNEWRAENPDRLKVPGAKDEKLLG